MRIKLADIKSLPGIQPRQVIDTLTVTEYADAMRGGATFPPVAVFGPNPNGKYILADGFHRVAAARHAELEDIETNVIAGGRAEAGWYALACNHKHGLRRSNADKRRGVFLALRHAEGSSMSNRAIAAYVGVSEGLVRIVRDEGENDGTFERRDDRVVGLDGQSYVSTQGDEAGRSRVAPDPVESVPSSNDGPASPPVSIPERDRAGRPVPESIRDSWTAAAGAADVARNIRSARLALRTMMANNEAGIVTNQTVADLKNAEVAIKRLAIPTAVCPTCEGLAPENCETCGGRGWIPEQVANQIGDE